MFLPYGTQIPKADKGSILRLKVYKEFEKVIEEVYIRLEGEVGSKGKMRVEGVREAREAVKEIIRRTVERPIDGLEDGTDLFDFGLDSLQSTWIRNTIQRVCAFVSLSGLGVIGGICRRLIWVERSCLSTLSLNTLPLPSASVSSSL